MTGLAGQRVIRLAGRSLIWQPRVVLVCLGLLLACAGAGVLLLGSGTIRIAPGQVLAALTGNAPDETVNRLIGRIRLPRMLTAALVGAALGMAGAVFQSLSRNPLGSPDVIGFTTGAASGAILQIVLIGGGPAQITLSAMASGIATAVAVLALAYRRGAGPGGGYRLILVGIGMGALLSGINTLLLVKGDLERVMSAQLWLAGSLTARSWSHVWIAASGLLLLVPIVLWNARSLALMEMGEDMARQLGLRVVRTRMVLVLAAVGLTSVATACTGPIAFIALGGPQIARRLTGSSGVPLVSGAITGALLLLCADLLGQNAPLGLTMPVGLTTGFLGGLYLLVLLGFSDRR
ncbi:FecCD family ABC transporter permease [Gemmobacter serpentinus]|uniref:FecCD family ABC transporter permease n=1 Tax=Gemmobacter serpentinus TaxID=2652247 RepID=UPI00124E2467|nr:iron chelate uptake ABC transporter family permease subunit [Gemmobacter serpentinus]